MKISMFKNTCKLRPHVFLLTNSCQPFFFFFFTFEMLKIAGVFLKAAQSGVLSARLLN